MREGILVKRLTPIKLQELPCRSRVSYPDFFNPILDGVRDTPILEGAKNPSLTPFGVRQQ